MLTLDLANDCLRFVISFFEVISISVPHIYHSALPLSPQTSAVWKLYGKLAKPFARVIQGVSATWDPSIANKILPRTAEVIALSPCSRLIAVGQDATGVIILDAATLHQLHTLYPPHIEDYQCAIFSPDSHLLSAHTAHNILSWNLQTGGIISEIWVGFTFISCMAYSGCGTMVGVLHAGYEGWAIDIYDVFSGTGTYYHSLQSPILRLIWTHNKSFQFATLESGSVTLWEVGFISSTAPIPITSLPIPESLFIDHQNVVLLPANSLLAFTCQGRIVVWDAQNYKILLDSKDPADCEHIVFSARGSFVLCGGEKEFYIWKESPNGYHLHQKFVSNSEIQTPTTFPTEGSFVSCADEMLQLWQIPDSPDSLPRISTQAAFISGGTFPLLEISPDESLVAAVGRSEKTVALLDVKSGSPQLTVDADTEISGMKITRDKIILVCHPKIITWCQGHSHPLAPST